MKIRALDRIFLLLVGLLAAYQIAVGVEGLALAPMLAYTVAFGVLLVASLMLIILGFGALESPYVVIVSSLVPLSLSLGLVWEHFGAYRVAYLLFTGLGLLGIVITRLVPMPGRLPTLVLAFTHGVAGMTIFLLPLSLVWIGQAAPGYAFVSLGGACIGLGGLLLSFWKAGKPLLSGALILKLLPGLLLLTTAAFTLGFAGL